MPDLVFVQKAEDLRSAVVQQEHFAETLVPDVPKCFRCLRIGSVENAGRFQRHADNCADVVIYGYLIELRDVQSFCPLPVRGNVV